MTSVLKTEGLYGQSERSNEQQVRQMKSKRNRVTRTGNCPFKESEGQNKANRDVWLGNRDRIDVIQTQVTLIAVVLVISFIQDFCNDFEVLLFSFNEVQRLSCTS